MTTEHERGVVVTQDTTCEDDRMAVHNTEPLEGVGQSESAAEDHDEDQDEENGSEGSQEQDASIANSVEEEDGQDPKKKTLPGIVYIGHIPPRLRPRYLRTMLGAYGEIGRVFLNPESKNSLTLEPRTNREKLSV